MLSTDVIVFYGKIGDGRRIVYVWDFKCNRSKQLVFFPSNATGRVLLSRVDDEQFVALGAAECFFFSVTSDTVNLQQSSLQRSDTFHYVLYPLHASASADGKLVATSGYTEKNKTTHVAVWAAEGGRWDQKDCLNIAGKVIHTRFEKDFVREKKYSREEAEASTRDMLGEEVYDVYRDVAKSAPESDCLGISGISDYLLLYFSNGEVTRFRCSGGKLEELGKEVYFFLHGEHRVSCLMYKDHGDVVLATNEGKMYLVQGKMRWEIYQFDADERIRQICNLRGKCMGVTGKKAVCIGPITEVEKGLRVPITDYSERSRYRAYSIREKGSDPPVKGECWCCGEPAENDAKYFACSLGIIPEEQHVFIAVQMKRWENETVIPMGFDLVVKKRTNVSFDDKCWLTTFNDQVLIASLAPLKDKVNF